MTGVSGGGDDVPAEAAPGNDQNQFPVEQREEGTAPARVVEVEGIAALVAREVELAADTSRRKDRRRSRRTPRVPLYVWAGLRRTLVWRRTCEDSSAWRGEEGDVWYQVGQHLQGDTCKRS